VSGENATTEHDAARGASMWNVFGQFGASV